VKIEKPPSGGFWVQPAEPASILRRGFDCWMQPWSDRAGKSHTRPSVDPPSPYCAVHISRADQERHQPPAMAAAEAVFGFPLGPSEKIS
jgi:hypothetical protein